MIPSNLPFISVIVPVFNGARVMEECLEALVGQDYPAEYEVLVVDNASTDGTAEIVRKYPVRLLFERETKSSFATRNVGIRHAKGDILAFTDANCVPAKHWLRELVAGWEDETIGCWAGEFEPYPPSTVVEEYQAYRRHVFQGDKLDWRPLVTVMTGNCAYRRAVFDQLGLFDAALISGGDTDLSTRLVWESDWQIRYNPGAMVRYRYRRTVKEFWNRQFRMAYGTGVLYETKYRHLGGFRVGAGTGTIARAVLERGGTFLGKLICRAVGQPVTELDLYAPLLDTIHDLARFHGRNCALVECRLRRAGSRSEFWRTAVCGGLQREWAEAKNAGQSTWERGRLAVSLLVERLYMVALLVIVFRQELNIHQRVYGR
jgi:glycosyltransferase involved in cell wall biosynthesis